MSDYLSMHFQLDLLGTIGLALTIAALILTLLQFRSARGHTRELDAIRRSMSTRYVGEFPAYLPELVRLLGTARSSIAIGCGVVTYGLFSDRANWLRYRTAIERKLGAGIEVEILSSDEAGRRRHQIEQFGLDRPWEVILRDEQFAARMTIFARHYSSKPEYRSWSVDELVGLLEAQQQQVLNNDFRAASRHETADSMPLHYWIVDDARAMFSIPRFGEAPTELGFITSDSRLIQALRTVHRRRTPRQV